MGANATAVVVAVRVLAATLLECAPC